jgi:hypothetical protein
MSLYINNIINKKLSNQFRLNSHICYPYTN